MRILVAAILAFVLAPVLARAEGWQTSSPEAQGMSSRELAGLVEFGITNGMDSALVVRHGSIVAEAYYAPFARDEAPHQLVHQVGDRQPGQHRAQGRVARERRPAGARLLPRALVRQCRRAQEGARAAPSPRHDVRPGVERAAE